MAAELGRMRAPGLVGAGVDRGDQGAVRRQHPGGRGAGDAEASHADPAPGETGGEAASRGGPRGGAGHDDGSHSM